MYSKKEIQQALAQRHSLPVQQLLEKGKVVIVGLGGLGSNVAILLARMGVGQIHIIDFDVVDLTNLNRQQYFLEHIGKNKTDALKQQILKINPYLNVITDCVRVTEQNIKQLLFKDDIICEALDDPKEKAIFVNGVRESFPHKKLVASSGLAGYESSNLIQTRKVSPNFYLCGDGITQISEKRGLMAARAALCACHQANMITRLLLGEEEA